ncbi:hypothetical protein NC796_22150 [Aliifodinibius sp. S!AR15-10]|uniref:hypothetical protein n=1 Tax=Aliifodinibius sp. S!AR15-10 TaxID=2950437 RepID=UPI002856AD73|nr:hypothetical protein [Aliifodinibius sp. S!AR15-10]MDR8393872.1 hypothetical protein [Aliifodinibius sp. S!AR15-10]
MIISTKKTALFIGLLFTLSVATGFAQNRPEVGDVGLSASVQTNQTNLSVPIWASEQVVIAPVFGLVHEEENFTTVNVGIKPRFYRDLGNNFASYVGLQGLIQYTSPEFGDELTDIVIGATGGGEYFLDSHFSLGVEGQLNFLFRDNDENRVATGAAVTGTFYF